MDALWRDFEASFVDSMSYLDSLKSPDSSSAVVATGYQQDSQWNDAVSHGYQQDDSDVQRDDTGHLGYQPEDSNYYGYEYDTRKTDTRYHGYQRDSRPDDSGFHGNRELSGEGDGDADNTAIVTPAPAAFDEDGDYYCEREGDEEGRR